MIIDTHCHVGVNWFEPVESLLFQMNENDVEKALIVQHGGSYDHDYIFSCFKSYPEKFRIVALVDWSSKDKIIQLEKLKKRGAVGIRIYLNEDLFSEAGLNFCKRMAELDLKASVAGNLESFASDEFRLLIERCPDESFIIEHLANVGSYIEARRDQENVNMRLFEKVLELSRYPNVFMKIPGLGELNPRPIVLHETRPFNFDKLDLIKKSLNAFTSKKLMWGSDYPPVSNREGYRNALNGVRSLDVISDIEAKDIFNSVPAKLFFC